MISNLVTLRAALADYLDRSDIASATLDTFIDVGRRAAARVEAREQEQNVLLTLDVELRATLPARFMSARMVYTEIGINVPQVSSQFASLGAEGGYRIIGPILEATGGGLKLGDKLELHYYEFPSALVTDTDTNTFLQANADLWLWQAIAEAARYLRNEELANAASQAIGVIGSGIQTTAQKGRQHGGPRQMRVRN